MDTIINLNGEGRWMYSPRPITGIRIFTYQQRLLGYLIEKKAESVEIPEKDIGGAKFDPGNPYRV